MYYNSSSSKILFVHEKQQHNIVTKQQHEASKDISLFYDVFIYGKSSSNYFTNQDALPLPFRTLLSVS